MGSEGKEENMRSYCGKQSLKMSLGILCAAALSHTTNAFGGCPVSVGSTRSAKMSMSRFRHAPALAQAPTRWGVRASTLLSLRMSDEQVSSWDSAKVGAWLEKEGFNADWQKAFSDNEIDGEALKLLKDPSVLDDMQIPKQVGARLKFWQKLDLIVPPDERGTTTLSVAAVQAPEEQVAAPAVAAASSFSSPGTMTGTQTLVAPVSVDEAAKVAGTSLSAPLDGMSLESLMADEAKFVDGMCQLLADLDAKERDVTLLLDMKDRLNNLFSVVIVGEFNAGKSSLINAILGSRFCQEGVVPTTTTINMLRYGEGEESGQIQQQRLSRTFLAGSPPQASRIGGYTRYKRYHQGANAADKRLHSSERSRDFCHFSRAARDRDRGQTAGLHPRVGQKGSHGTE